MSTPLLRNDKRLINRWAMYDWSNSVYSLTIATAVFPIYYTNVTNAINHGVVSFMGREYMNEALYSYALSFSFLVVALISPLLAPIADYKSAKLGFMKFFCYTGAVSCIALYWFTGENVCFGIFFFVLASVGFAGSIVYYNAFLKEIVDEHDQDRVSAKGFSLGYIGSVILLIINLAMVQKPEWFGLRDAGQAARLTFVSVGIWWAGFAQIPFSALSRFKYDVPGQIKQPSEDHDEFYARRLQRVAKSVERTQELSFAEELSFCFFLLQLSRANGDVPRFHLRQQSDLRQ